MKVYDLVIERVVGNIVRAVDIVVDLFNGDTSINKLFDDFVEALENIPSRISVSGFFFLQKLQNKIKWVFFLCKWIAKLIKFVPIASYDYTLHTNKNVCIRENRATKFETSWFLLVLVLFLGTTISNHSIYNSHST